MYYGVKESVTPQFPTGGDIGGRTDAWGVRSNSGRSRRNKSPKDRATFILAFKNTTGIYLLLLLQILKSTLGDVGVSGGVDLTVNEKYTLSWFKLFNALLILW